MIKQLIFDVTFSILEKSVNIAVICSHWETFVAQQSMKRRYLNRMFSLNIEKKMRASVKMNHHRGRFCIMEKQIHGRNARYESVSE